MATLRFLAVQFQHLALFFFLIFCGNSPVYAQQLEFGKPFIQNFKVKDYQAEAQNWSIAKDKHGFLYFANTGGILQYDGSQWEVIPTEKNSPVMALATDLEGNVYVGGMKELGMLRESSEGKLGFVSFLSKIEEKYHDIDEVRRIVQFDGKMYFCAAKYLFEYADDTIKTIEMPSRINRFDTVMNKLVFITEAGLSFLKNDHVHPIAGTEELAGKKLAFTSSMPEKLIIGTYFNGIYTYRDSTLSPLPGLLNEFFKENIIYSAHQFSDSLLAIGTIKGGVVIVDNNMNLVNIISKDDGLVDNSIYYLHHDGQNGLWAGTGHGISRVEYPSPFEYFDETSGVGGTTVSITRHDGHIYINTNLATYRLDKPEINDVISKGKRPFFTKLESNAINNWWLSSYDGKLFVASQDGLLQVEGDKVRRINNDAATFIFPSRKFKDIIYVGLFRGLKVYKYNSGNLELINFFDDIEPDIRSINEEGDYLWLCSVASGINRMKFKAYDDTPEIDFYGLEDGLPEIRDNLMQMVDDKLMFYTRNGVYSFNYETDRFEPNELLHNLYADQSQFIFSMSQAPDGDVYMSSFNNTETVKLDKQLNGKYNLIRNPLQRLKGKQVYHTLAERNKIWFTSPEYIASYNPAQQFQADTCSFNVAIRKITLNEDSVISFHSKKEDRILLPYKSKQTIRFTGSALFYHLPEQTSYQYQLVGYDKEWSTWTKENFRIYTNLPSGEYEFNIRAKNAYGTRSMASLSFNIATPWHQSWWIITLASMLGLTMLVRGVQYISTRKLVSRVEELEMQQRVQKERERISSDLHDHVGAQLTSIISGLKITENMPVFQQDDQVKRLIDSLKEDAEITITQLRDTIWTLHQKEITLSEFADHVEKYVSRTLKYVRKPKFIMEVKADHHQKMDPNKSLNLMRIIQEALQNALKHASANNFIIQVMERDHQLLIIIKDDGIGFSINEDLRGEHFGLENMRHRVKECGGLISIESAIGEGTVIEIAFQL